MTIDPIEALNHAAGRKLAEEKAADMISMARQSILIGNRAKLPDIAFFSTLMLKLQPVPCWEFDTAATDGKRLAYNPSWICSLTKEEVLGIVAHEALHPGMQHHTRKGEREHDLYNIAADAAINPILLEAKFTLPKNGVFPGQGQFSFLPKDKSMEEYYRILWDYYEKNPKKRPSGRDPGGCGGVEAPDKDNPSAVQQAKAEWEANVIQAANNAKLRGQLSAGLQRLVDGVLKAKVNWRAVLRDFLAKRAKVEYRWNPPARNHIWRGIYLPAMGGQKLDGIVIAVDTSGSIGPKELNAFAAEVQGVAECSQSKLTILYCDCAINAVQTWEPSDGDLVLEPHGGGGTSHVPVMDWIDENMEEVTALVCLTDLETCFPPAPLYPVLWAVVGNPGAVAPFGTTIHVEVD